MNNKTKKILLITVIVLIILAMIFIIYDNLFADSSSSRFNDSSKYTLSNDEINSVKDKLSELDNVDDISIYTNSKIIKIMINLKEDIDLSDVKSISNEAVNLFDEKNLSYYDVEIFIESANEESDTYPVIGYKHKSRDKFSW